MAESRLADNDDCESNAHLRAAHAATGAMTLTESVQHARPESAGRPARWRRLVIPAVLILGASVLVCAIALMRPPHAPVQPAEVAPINVRVYSVQPLAELADTFDLTAVVEPERIVTVAAEVAGRLERYGQRPVDTPWHGQVLPAGSTLQEGEPVRAGDPLVYLNTDLLQARHERVLAQYEYDEREYNRILDLFERGSTSRTELDDARTRRDVSRAALAEATRELERTTITAPVAGILNRLPMEIGEYAVSGDRVAEIVQLDTVKVVADVPERDVPYLRIGQPAAAIPLNGGHAPLAGTITYINAIADESTRTTRIEITVDNRAEQLRSGQIVKAHLTRQVLRDVIMIPLASVIPLEAGKMVYVVENGQAARRDVELGFIKGRDVRILSGLQADDQLIVAGHRYVGPGQRVTVVEEQSGGP